MVDDRTIEMGETSNISKVISLRKIVRGFELQLKGYSWNEGGTSYEYKGTPMCGSIVIAKGVMLLHSFCEEANLLTSKDDRVFSKQKFNALSTFNTTLLLEPTCPASNYNVIMMSFWFALQNIGDIIRKSRSTIPNMLAGGLDMEKKAGEAF